MSGIIREASYSLVYNLFLGIPGQEYSFKLNDGVRRFLVRARESEKFNMSFQQNESGSNYLEIRSGEYYLDEEVYKAMTLYFQAAAPITLEIVEWVK